ncbi:glutamate synthase central domain-containing protein, partial [Staphylococcus hominis]|uniref:glutamate synthase central domain-containing protein n=1 Tax=Staphylococcus hominis TaxID=1290 RepID=UPI0011A2DBBD
LLPYAANPLIPYLPQQTIPHLTHTHHLQPSISQNLQTYTNLLSQDIIKLIPKMPISTLQTYQPPQIFQPVPLSQNLIHTYFTRTQSKLSRLS